jgi:hypothetical protein
MPSFCICATISLPSTVKRDRRVEHAAAELVRKLIGEIGGAQPKLVVLSQLGLGRVAAPPVGAIAIGQPGAILPADDHRYLAATFGGQDVAGGLGQHDLRVLVDELKRLREFRQVRHEVPNVGVRGEIIIHDAVKEIVAVRIAIGSPRRIAARDCLLRRE